MAARDLVGHARVDQLDGQRLMLLAPVRGAQARHRLGERHERVAGGRDRRLDVSAGRMQQVPARDARDEIVDPVEQPPRGIGVDRCDQALDLLPALGRPGHLAGDPEGAHDLRRLGATLGR